MPGIILGLLTLFVAITGRHERRAVLTHVYVLDVTLPSSNASPTLAREIAQRYQRSIVNPAGTDVRISEGNDPDASCEPNIACDIISVVGRAPGANEKILKVDMLIVSHPSKNEHPDSRRSKLCQVEAVSDTQWRACTIARANLRSTTTKIQEHIQWHTSNAQ